MTLGTKKRTKKDKAETPWIKFQTESESNYLKSVLLDHNFNMMQTAKHLGLQRSHLYNLIKKYKISRPGIDPK